MVAGKAPKKRSYANAYARRGQGFSALVDSLAFEDAEAAAEDAALKVEQGTDIPHPAPAAADEQPERAKGRKSRKKTAVKAPSLLEAVEVTVKTEVCFGPSAAMQNTIIGCLPMVGCFARKPETGCLNCGFVQVPPAAEVLGAEEAKVPNRHSAGRARKASVKQEQETRQLEAERDQLAADPTLTAAPKRQRKRRQADPNAPPPFGESQASPMHAWSPTALLLPTLKCLVAAYCLMTSPDHFTQARKEASQAFTVSPELHSLLAEIPAVEILEEAVKVEPAPRPVPNLGFACLNATLRAQKPPIFSNRDCIQRTFQAKGLDWISQLALENSRALAGLISWNHLNGIRFFRSTPKHASCWHASQRWRQIAS